MFRPKLSFRPLATSVALLLCAQFSSAANLFWDGGVADLGADGDGISLGGSGTWNASLLNWDNGSPAHVAWPNLGGDTAIFGGTLTATATVVVGTAGQLGTTLNVGGLTFNNAGAFGYVIGDVAGNGTLAFGSTAGVIDASALSNTTGLVTINSNLTGTAGLTISGAGGTSSSGFTRLGGDNTGLTGGITITRGGITAASSIGFGNNQITIGSGAAIMATGTQPLAVNNNITIGSGGAVFRSHSGAMLALNGVISEAAASTAFTIADSGVVRLNGINTYTGSTNINAGVISFSNIGDTTNGGNLGKAGNLNFNGGTLRFTGTALTTTRLMQQTGNGTFEVLAPNAVVNMNGNTSGGTSGRFLTKSGLGTMVLGGAGDNNNGRMTVAAGTLVLGKASSGSIHAIGSQGGTDVGLNINGGVAQLGGTGNDQIFNSTAVQMTGGVFDFNGRNETIDSLYGTGGQVINTSATASTITLGGNNNNGGNGTINNYRGALRDGAGVLNLVKLGTGTQILSGQNTYSGTTTVSGGTLQIGNGGGLGTGAITNNATIAVSGVTGTTLNSVTGTGALNLIGNATLRLTGNHTYAGATTVGAGVLNVAGTIVSPITVNTGGSLTGAGSTTGAITLNEGSTVIGGTSAVTGNGVTANLTTTGVNILVAGGTTGTNVADVIKYGNGAAPLVANFNTSGYRAGAVVADDTVNKKITLTYQAEQKTWNAAVTQWDTGVSATWTGGDAKFQTGDAVAFGELPGDTTVAIVGSVAPSATSFSHTTGTLTLNGAGSIGGAGGLSKTGNGTLVLGSPNTYYGQTIISAGTVKLAHNQALGASGVGNETIVNAGATLDVNGGLAANTLATTEIIKIAGTGVGGNGALINSATAADQNNALTFVTLTANASVGGGVGGTSRMDMRANADATPILDLAGFKLTKTGAGLFTVLGGVITGGDIEINTGSFRVEGNTYTTGTGTITVNSGATFSVYGNNGGFNRPVVVNAGANFANGGSAAVINSDITLAGAGNLASTANAQFASNAVTTTLAGNISGPGSFSKTNTGVFVLAGNNTYAGYTLIREGTLRVGSNTAIPVGSKLVMYKDNSPIFDLNGFNVSLGALNSGSASDAAAVVNLGTGGKLTVTGNTAAAVVSNLAGVFYGKFTGIGDIEYNNTASPQGAWDWLNTTSDFVGNITVTSGRLRFVGGNGANESTALGNVDNDIIFNGTPVNTLNNGGGTASLQITNGTASQINNLGSARSIILNSGKEGTFYVWGVAPGTFMNVNGVVTGGGILRKEDSGVLALYNQGNNYTGETRIVNGTLLLGAAGVVPDVSVVRLGTSNANSPKLDLNGFNETIGGLTSVQLSDSSVRVNGVVTSTNAATLTINNNVDHVYGGSITGNVALTKFGSAKQTLSGANSYSGPTTINEGALIVSGSISGSTVTVNSTGLLGGGTVNLASLTGDVIVNSGGTLAPGVAGAGTLAVGALTLNSGSIFALDISAVEADQVIAGGTVTLAGNVQLSISLSSLPVDQAQFTILNPLSAFNGYSSGARFALGLNALDDGEVFVVTDNNSLLTQAFSINYAGGDGNDVVLTAVPEPGVAAALLSGLGCLAGLRRIRRRR